MSNESTTHQQFRKSLYHLHNWSARKAADEMERVLTDRVSSELSRATKVHLIASEAQSIVLIGVLWAVRKRFQDELPKAGIESIFDRFVREITADSETFSAWLVKFGDALDDPEESADFYYGRLHQDALSFLNLVRARDEKETDSQ